MNWLRVVAVVVGSGALVASAHLSVIHTGGYEKAGSYVTLFMAVIIAAAALCLGRNLSLKKWGWAVLFVASLAAGESYNIVVTMKRKAAEQRELQAPLTLAQAAYRKAENRAKDAKAAAANFPATSPRLVAAETALSDVTARAMATSAAPSCRDVCKSQLTDARTAAQSELATARAEHEQSRKATQREQEVASAALENMEKPPAEDALAAMLGMSTAVLNISEALLYSFALNITGCVLMGWGTHGSGHGGRRERETAPEPASGNVVNLAPAAARKVDESREIVIGDAADTQSRVVVPMRRVPEPSAEVSHTVCRPILTFIRDNVQDAPSEDVNLAICFGKLLHWRDRMNESGDAAAAFGSEIPAIEPADFRTVLDVLVARGHFRLRKKGREILIVGHKLMG